MITSCVVEKTGRDRPINNKRYENGASQKIQRSISFCLPRPRVDLSVQMLSSPTSRGCMHDALGERNKTEITDFLTDLYEAQSTVRSQSQTTEPPPRRATQDVPPGARMTGIFRPMLDESAAPGETHNSYLPPMVERRLIHG